MTHDKIRVLIVTKGLEIGGAEILLLSQAQVRDRESFDYVLFYVREDLDRLRDRFASIGVPVHCGNNIRDWDVRWLLRLRRLILRERINVVHTHLPLAGSLTRLVLRTIPRNRRPAHIYTEHCVWSAYVQPTRQLNRLTLRLDAHAFAVSTRVLECMPQRGRDHSEVLLHGIDLSMVRAASAQRARVRADWPIDAEAVVIGCVANHRAEKALHHLLAAADEVLSVASNVAFVQIGDGPLTKQLLAEHARRGLGERFRFLGRRSDAVQLMAGMDVFTLSSVGEGLPVAAMEASALGIPVVATDVGGLSEIVNDGESGLLVPCGDPHALAIALLRLVRDDEKRKEMGESARARSDIFDVARTVEVVEAAYRRYARPPAPPVRAQ